MPRATRIARKYREIQLSSCLCSSRELLLPSLLLSTPNVLLSFGERGKKETINKYSSVVPQSFFSPSFLSSSLFHPLSLFLSPSRENSRLSVFHELVMSRHLDRELGRERRPSQTREKETDVSCSSRSLHSRSSLRRYLFPFFFTPLPMLLGIAYTLEKVRAEKYFSGIARGDGRKREKRGGVSEGVEEEKLLPGKREDRAYRCTNNNDSHSLVVGFSIRDTSFSFLLNPLIFLLYHSPSPRYSAFQLFFISPRDDSTRRRRRRRGRTTMLHLLLVDSYRIGRRIGSQRVSVGVATKRGLETERRAQPGN